MVEKNKLTSFHLSRNLFAFVWFGFAHPKVKRMALVPQVILKVFEYMQICPRESIQIWTRTNMEHFCFHLSISALVNRNEHKHAISWIKNSSKTGHLVI